MVRAVVGANWGDEAKRVRLQICLAKKPISLFVFREVPMRTYNN